MRAALAIALFVATLPACQAPEPEGGPEGTQSKVHFVIVEAYTRPAGRRVQINFDAIDQNGRHPEEKLNPGLHLPIERVRPSPVSYTVHFRQGQIIQLNFRVTVVQEDTDFIGCRVVDDGDLMDHAGTEREVLGANTSAVCLYTTAGRR
jgi:hypothetical protein